MINKGMNGRQTATDRWSSLLAFGFAGLAIVSYPTSLHCVVWTKHEIKRALWLEMLTEELPKTRLELACLHVEERNMVKHSRHLQDFGLCTCTL